MIFGDLYDCNNLYFFYNGFVFLIRKVNNCLDKVDCEDIYDINKFWDELFELYLMCEVVFCDDNDRWNFKYV